MSLQPGVGFALGSHLARSRWGGSRSQQTNTLNQDSLVRLDAREDFYPKRQDYTLEPKLAVADILSSRSQLS